MRAMSSGLPNRRSGISRSVRARFWGSEMAGMSAIMSVSIVPGWMLLTRMPQRPRSLAATLVMPRTAHFVAAYAVEPNIPCTPAMVLGSGVPEVVEEPQPRSDVDAYGGWSYATGQLAGGGQYVQRLVTMRHFDMHHAKSLARRILEPAAGGEAQGQGATAPL